MKSASQTRKIALFAVTALTAGLLASQQTSAHPEGPAHHSPLPTHASATMRAFADDNHADQSLAAASTTACVGGFAGIYPCSNVDLEAFLPLSQIGGTASQAAANDIWGWTDSVTGS